ncbi:hypothetical protein QT970_24905 [Microcoleus sp. herbarium8]
MKPPLYLACTRDSTELSRTLGERVEEDREIEIISQQSTVNSQQLTVNS